MIHAIIWVMEIHCTLLPRYRLPRKVLTGLAEYVEDVRNAVGYEMPLCADHFGHFDVNNAIRFGKSNG